VLATASLVLAACGGDEAGDSPSRADEGRKTGSPNRSQEGGGGATVSGRYRAFVALEDGDAVGVLGGPPWRLLRRIAVPRGPHNVAASPDGRYVAVSSPPAGRVTLIRTRTATVVARAVVAGRPHDVAFTPDGHRLWVTAESDRRLVKLSVPGGGRVFSRGTGGPPHDLDVYRREVWVTIDGSSAAEVRSAGAGRLLARAPLGIAPHDVAFEPRGRRVWLSNWSSSLLTVASVRSRRRLATLQVGTEPHHFAFGLGCLWASDNGGGALVRIDPDSRRIRGRTRLGPGPHHVAIAGNNVLVAVNGSGRVAAVSARGRLLRTLRMGAGPHGIAAVAITARASALRERSCR
jgi:DNA-binding beta-propeller fold protein YncE